MWLKYDKLDKTKNKIDEFDKKEKEKHWRDTWHNGFITNFWGTLNFSDKEIFLFILIDQDKTRLLVACFWHTTFYENDLSLSTWHVGPTSYLSPVTPKVAVTSHDTFRLMNGHWFVDCTSIVIILKCITNNTVINHHICINPILALVHLQLPLLLLPLLQLSLLFCSMHLFTKLPLLRGELHHFFLGFGGFAESGLSKLG